MVITKLSPKCQNSGKCCDVELPNVVKILDNSHRAAMFLCRLSPSALAVFNVTISCGQDVLNYACNLYFFIHRKAVAAWSSSNSLVLLGSTLVPRLPIFSFLIRHPIAGVFLHHNYVCALLNDLFGIQARGGCACAGPYAQVSAILSLYL